MNSAIGARESVAGVADGDMFIIGNGVGKMPGTGVEDDIA